MAQNVASAEWLLNLTSIFRRPANPLEDMIDLSDEELDCDLDLLQGLPKNLFQDRTKLKPKPVVESPTRVIELSCRKLRSNTKRTRRPLQQTLLIHRTLTLAKAAKRPPSTARPALRRTASQSPDEGFDGVAKPPKAFCRNPMAKNHPVHQYNPVGDPQIIQPPRAVQAW
ncbi:hypothetical protein DSO57_1009330 [Entomophthora muscae]|uniref:Uncharacterized protein n=1 Tax=Entomophthora muscae TaxID=34485 RepID=A0ACC2S8W7_9FUNG|nr:hypothetical protein DSO57_1009330 [Entomophthora muscae]